MTIQYHSSTLPARMRTAHDVPATSRRDFAPPSQPDPPAETSTAAIVQRAILVSVDRDCELRKTFLRRRWQLADVRCA